MTKKSRYFLVGSPRSSWWAWAAGWSPIYRTTAAPGVPAGLPAELRYVPADAEMVAYADVRR